MYIILLLYFYFVSVIFKELTINFSLRIIIFYHFTKLIKNDTCDEILLNVW
jgi:hypothetical protein